MRYLMTALSLALLVPLPCTSMIRAEAPEKPRFTLAIHTNKAQVTKGEDVEIVIKITNISVDPIAFSFGYHGNVPDGYQFEIRDEQGNEVQPFGPRYRKMPNGRMFRLPDRPAGSKVQGDIAPGNSVEESATISDEYPFNQAGTYSIRVSKIDSSQAPDSPGVCSNTITVTVLASEGTPPKD